MYKRQETGLGPREAMFVVRPAEGAARAPVAWVLADFTLQAYNTAGGRSSYNYASRDKRMATRLRPLAKLRAPRWAKPIASPTPIMLVTANERNANRTTQGPLG